MKYTKIPEISRDEVQAKLNGGTPFVLVEALSPAHYQKGHLPKAINLPAGQVRELAPKRVPDQSADIVVYCANPS